VKAGFTACRTPVEQELAQSGSKSSRLNGWDIYDNFFKLGGDSLLATQVVSRLRSFQVELPLGSLFQAPTVAELAVAITQSQAEMLKRDEIAGMLAQLECLSDEQNGSLLTKRGRGVKKSL
jgi:aryl carrier-like protein